MHIIFSCIEFKQKYIIDNNENILINDMSVYTIDTNSNRIIKKVNFTVRYENDIIVIEPTECFDDYIIFYYKLVNAIMVIL